MDLEVHRVSHKPGSFLTLTSVHAVFKTPIHLAHSKFTLVPLFIRISLLPAGLAIPPLLSLRLYAFLVDRRLRNLPTMPPGEELSATINLKRQWERLIGLDFLGCSPLCYLGTALSARIPLLPTEILEFMADALPPDQMDVACPGGLYGNPRDTMNDLVQVTIIGDG